MNRIRIAVLPLLVALGCAHAAPPPVLSAPVGSLDARTAGIVDALVSREMAEQNLAGASVALVVHDQLVYARGYGFADVEAHSPVLPETPFRLASVSKTLTAVAAMHLAELGQIDLDAPVQKYVPAFPQKPWPITARELLGHLGGIRHYKGHEIALNTHYADLDAPLQIFANDSLIAEPRTRFFYSSYGFNLLGAEMERAAERSFAAIVREAVLQPASMASTALEDVTVPTPHAVGYERDGDSLERAVAYDPSNKFPSGGFVSTASDLARFAIALDTDRLLRRETRDSMWTEQQTSSGRGTHYGLGFGLGRWRELPTAFHDGGQPGVSTLLFMVPSQGLAVVILSNTGGAKLDPLSHKLASALLAEPPQAARF